MRNHGALHHDSPCDDDRPVHEGAKSEYRAPVTPTERKVPTRQQKVPDPVPGRGDRARRSGSRLLLAAALAAGVIGAFFAGAMLADFLCDITGVTSTAVRLGVKVASIVVAIPVGFYMVERIFLSRSSRASRNN